MAFAFILEEHGHMMAFNRLEEAILTGGLMWRLLLAAFLGGAIGLDREYHHKPSGLRTNLLISFGAALFTFLSPVIAGAGGNNLGQIAANIVQGIGFLGAGLIMRNHDRVNGLTSAATVWAVASIGMACGAGLYGPAVFSTVLVLVALEGIGLVEKKFNIKLYSVLYEIRGRDETQMSMAVLRIMDHEKNRLPGLDTANIGELNRLSFSVTLSRRGHERILSALQGSSAVDEVLTFHDPEED